MTDASARDRREEHNPEGDPDNGDGDVDEPFGLRVFLALRDAERHRRHREDAPELPSPEREIGERGKRKARVARALNDVVARPNQRGATEREDDAEGMVRTNAAEGQPRHAEIE